MTIVNDKHCITDPRKIIQVGGGLKIHYVWVELKHEIVIIAVPRIWCTTTIWCVPQTLKESFSFYSLRKSGGIPPLKSLE